MDSECDRNPSSNCTRSAIANPLPTIKVESVE